MSSCKKYSSPYNLRKTKSEAAEFKEWFCLYLGENTCVYDEL